MQNPFRFIRETQKNIDRNQFIHNKYIRYQLIPRHKQPIEKKTFYFTMENENTDPPIFIIGCGHSGTTLMRKMMGTHSNIYDIGYETDIFLTPINTISQLRRVIDKIELLNQNTVAMKKRRWIEKTPRHVHHIETIYKFFPNCKTIIMMRHPISCIKSLYKRYKNLEQAVERYIIDNLTWINSKHMNDFILLKYEDLIQHTHFTIKHILHGIGEEYEDITQYKCKDINYNENRVCSRCGVKNIRPTTCFVTHYHCTACDFYGLYNDIKNMNHRKERQIQINKELYNNLKNDESIETFSKEDLFFLKHYTYNDINIENLAQMMGYTFTLPL